ncbi:MAG: thioredoxin family protein [Bacteroidota bacterium]|nr:thioredoxin family protein [Bacteroidota bacterium]
MKKSFAFILFLLLFLSLPVLAQEKKFNRVVFDEKANINILLGYCTRDSLERGLFSSYFHPEYDNYAEDPVCDAALQKELSGDITITLVMGTWCSDSREQVPRFYRILDNAGFSSDKVTLICVNKEKKGGDVSLEELNIEKVPTFIIYRKGNEAGRIVETPAESLEKDLILILGK